jgi:NAD(P)H-hydrate epimerase
MEQFDTDLLKKLYVPSSDSHKGQNGKLLVIGGSGLFHAASLWALTIASRVVDMVFYASVKENNEIVHELKKAFRDGIVVPRVSLEDYIKEADCVLIGPGMMRAKQDFEKRTLSLEEIILLEDEGEQSYFLTRYLLEKYPEKKWVIDAGALQMMDVTWLRQLGGNVIITPHLGEFERVFAKTGTEEAVRDISNEYQCIVLCKGETDIICSPEMCVAVSGGNAGMTKGGTGDVLAGLIAALACKNDLWLAATAGSYFNKKAGESLFDRVGYYFNASDLAAEIPVVMKKMLG